MNWYIYHSSLPHSDVIVLSIMGIELFNTVDFRDKRPKVCWQSNIRIELIVFIWNFLLFTKH